jgi:hypothetical protein
VVEVGDVRRAPEALEEVTEGGFCEHPATSKALAASQTNPKNGR